MHDDPPIFPEHLSDEAAAQMLELLYAITQALENRYFAQIRRHYQETHPQQQQPDLWD
jgi:hypothetical protein